ncbi:armadillo repeat-containing protein 3-like [Actinia tenebrosa]|uniref:Armadillo repeat-containing protein 3-like n=1 Tax=Actinia tenebrosa TaxID=6105 RepID=A0A6P8I5D1_ACTTE|nr:armadillo repeat-containing protein 3-like [Actinia tenebrosa]
MGKKKTKEPEAPPKDEFDALELVSKKPHTVVLMLDSPEENIQQLACEALYKFSQKCDENRQLLMTLGALDPLLRLIGSEDKVVKRNAAMCLGTLSHNVTIHRELRKMSSVSSLVSLLGPEEDVLCHEFASLALANMSADFSSKIEIFEQGGLEPLIKLLSSPDCDVQKNSVESICHLVQDYHSRSAIRELNGIPSLLSMLSSEYAIIQQLALESLTQITLEAENRSALRELEGLEKLVDFVGNKEFDDLHVHALQVLTNCLQDVESMQVIQTSGALQKFLAFVAESQIPEVQQHAAKAIALAAKNVENRKILHEQECEKTLIALLPTDNPGIQTSLAMALAVMSENLSSRDTIGKLEGIQPIINLLNSESPDVREAGTLALANLTTSNPPNCSDVVEKGGIEPLIAMLTDPKSLIQSNAAVCLTNLASDESWRSEVQQRGVVPALVQALQSNAAVVQSKVAVTVAAFVGDADSRNELRAEGGLPRLVELLQSNNDEVRRSASWAILQCANDLPTATEICQLGGLDVLREISLSTTRQSGFASVAMECLLDSNLPAKYATTGSLSPSNIIQDGFYDVGPMKVGAKFLTLEELSKEPLNEHRPILLINSKEQQREVSSPILVVKEPEKPSPDKPGSKGSKSNLKSKSRLMREREEQKAKEEEAAPPEPQEPQEAPSTWTPPTDPAFFEYIEEIKSTIQPLLSSHEQIVALARFVSDKMGGPVERDALSSFSYELPISQIKVELDSNIIPIGRIHTGIFYHRALLFKALADRIAVSCSLIRGEYNRAWNEVMLCEDSKAGGPILPPKTYIVDLMYEPGRLMLSGSPDSITYQRL